MNAAFAGGLVGEADQPVPRVSIGLPVYNGERFIKEAVDSILEQTFTDFELIISDNASTDRTGEICKAYAEKDPRVRYSANATNIGGARNTNLTFQLARGEYFRWAAHDDVCAPQLLERCVEVLDANPDIFLVYPKIVHIDENGKQLSVTAKREGSGPTPFSRFRLLSSRKHACESIYGLIRTDVLRKTELLRDYTDADRVLLCELGMYGPFAQIPEPLFYKRHHAGNVYKDWRGRMAWFKPGLAQSGRPTFPYWNQYYNYFRAVHRVPVSLSQKGMCYLWLMGPWLARFGKGMAKDVFVAGVMLTRSQEWRKKKYSDTDSWA